MVSPSTDDGRRERPADKDPGDSPGIYIHVPFCYSRCGYCDFYSTTDSSRVSGYLDALEREMDFYRNDFGNFNSV
ncbi:MAG: hypothetical protein PHU03_06945, partial [Syntrophales bacterium]|nr:hypothetical protein [Syntrophales bacterium]